MPRKKAAELESELNTNETVQVEESAPAVAPAKKRKAFNDENVVTLIGTVAKNVVTPKQVVMTVSLYVNGGFGNFPTVKFFTKDLMKAASEFKEGERVKIRATIQSYNMAEHKDDGYLPYQLVAKSIERDEAVIAEPDEEGFAPISSMFSQDKNEILIKGTILKIEVRKNNQVLVTIRTHTDARMSIVELPYMTRNPEEALKNIHCLQRVRAYGSVQTANEPLDAEAEAQAEATVSDDLRSKGPRKHLRTKKAQYYVIHEIFVSQI